MGQAGLHASPLLDAGESAQKSRAQAVLVLLRNGEAQVPWKVQCCGCRNNAEMLM